MDLTHIHLLLNHVPTIGFAMALFLFLWSLIANSAEPATAHHNTPHLSTCVPSLNTLHKMTGPRAQLAQSVAGVKGRKAVQRGACA